MPKTKEEKQQYCKEWRIKNREKYLATKRKCYEKNKDGWRDKAKARASRYYYEVIVNKRKADPKKYKLSDRLHSIKRLEKRRKHIRELRESMGGKCSNCGYNQNIDILQFHHLGGKDKDVSLIQSYQKRIDEAKKCVLLCPNCHSIETLKRYV